jgi:copper homeostasis protein
MIRPRGGNFTYDDAEFNEMKASVIALKNLKADGFVFGILKEDKTINIEQNKSLVALAHPTPCAFHRAFDEVADAFDALEQIIECGFTTILTSGQAKNVTEGMFHLCELVSKATNRITIMPGGGLRSSNLAEIQEITKAVYFHSSAITNEGVTADAQEIQALKSRLK